MIIDCSPKSHGQFTVYATYAGSYGEKVRHLKRSYMDFKKACDRASTLVRTGALDAEVVDNRNRESYFFGRV